MHNIHFEDHSKDYIELLPDEVKKHLPIYKDLVYKVAEIQKKLEGNFYRVTNVDDLAAKVKDGSFKPGRYAVIQEISPREYKLVRYTQFFEKEFEFIRENLKKILKDLDKGPYKDYIESLITAYTNNNFIDPYKKWVQMKPEDYPVELMLFPVEVEFDRRFHTINSFDASLRVLAPEFLESAKKDYKNYLMGLISSLPEFSELHYKLNEDISRLNLRVDYSIFSAGVHAIVPYFSQNLPNERNFATSWGTKIIVYKTTLDKKINTDFDRLAKKIFVNFDMSVEEVSQSLIHKVYVHELVEGLMILAGARRRLNGEHPYVREFNSDAFGINSYVLYLLKTESDPKIIGNLATIYVLNAFEYYERLHTPETRTSHYKQYLAAINYFLEKGSLKINSDNKIEIDKKAVLKNVSELSKISSTLLMEGTEQEATDFFNKYGSEKPFKKVLNM